MNRDYSHEVAEAFAHLRTLTPSQLLEMKLSGQQSLSDLTESTVTVAQVSPELLSDQIIHQIGWRIVYARLIDIVLQEKINELTGATGPTCIN